MKTAWIFPGQGSQQPGMGRRLLQSNAEAQAIMQLAEEMSGLPLNRLSQRGPVAEVNRPIVAEPLIAAISLGYVACLRKHGCAPDYVAGYSAGEVAALYCAGVLGLEEALRLACLRGQLFEQYVSKDCRMSTCSGVHLDLIEELIQEWQDNGWDIHLAAANGEAHCTIVGEIQSTLRAEAVFLRLGGTCSQVQTLGKWHSVHLNQAAIQLSMALTQFSFQEPDLPILTSISGCWRKYPVELRSDLAFGVARPVMWKNIVENCFEEGVTHFLEVGSGRVLCGLLRWSGRPVESYSAICVEDRNGGTKPLEKLIDSRYSNNEGIG
jgi:[acyl-carrier-protein] S-malonyltransferase